ncbi:hypothetical protein GCM10025734_27070 [Kitasatospora paranensis]
MMPESEVAAAFGTGRSGVTVMVMKVIGFPLVRCGPVPGCDRVHTGPRPVGVPIAPFVLLCPARGAAPRAARVRPRPAPATCGDPYLRPGGERPGNVDWTGPGARLATQWSTARTHRHRAPRGPAVGLRTSAASRYAARGLHPLPCLLAHLPRCRAATPSPGERAGTTGCRAPRARPGADGTGRWARMGAAAPVRADAPTKGATAR